jgi:hypothetical protein
MVSVADVLKAIYHKESLDLFRIVAHAKLDTADILISKTELTRKQYYWRMSSMIKAGLIKRKKGKYTLTTLGKVVYDTQIKIENAVNCYWRLKALDSLEDSNDLLPQGRNELIDKLIDNQEIKDILVSDTAKDNKLESNQPLINTEQRQIQNKQIKKTRRANRETNNSSHI